MKAAVILNRMFRTKNNPLLEYIHEHLDDYTTLNLVIPVEEFDDGSPLKKDYYTAALSHFVKALKDCGIEPCVLKYSDLEHFLTRAEVDTVITAGDIMSYHKKQYDINEMKQLYNRLNIDVVSLSGHHYFKPARTLNQSGDPYKVFTSFYKKNRGDISFTQMPSIDLSKIGRKSKKGTIDIKLNCDGGVSEQEAIKKWHAFLNGDIEDYEHNREVLSTVKTSQLSILLSHGVIDIRSIMNDLINQYDASEKNMEAFIRELMFREFYYVLMTYYPESAEQSFKTQYQGIRWSSSETNFEAWKDGQTGYPLIDAAMNELKETGYMHNRMRMVTAQFLTKHLFIDWRRGEDYFRYHLIDYDNASNTHGWQWAASTGTDAVPYFRMFNPIRQSERFDSDGDYIKQYLEVFNRVPAKYLHHPTKHQKVLKETYNIDIGTDYPAEIVEHSAAREFIMDVFKEY